MTSHYDSDFYAQQRDGSKKAAKVILDLVHQVLHPTSILDVGCGVGAWVAHWGSLGVEQAFGCDGSYIDPTTLDCPRDSFIAVDLADPPSLEERFRNTRFDLISSLEVAEHLPARVAESFVRFLCGHSDYVLFGAAVPGQGGAHHVNERFASYWVNFFRKCGHLPIDFIRPLIFSESIPFWYRQNTILFARAGEPVEHVFSRLSDLDLVKRALQSPMDLIHPTLYSAKLARVS